MKKTPFLLVTLVTGLALAGCNKSTRTSTASSDTSTPATDTSSATASSATTPASTSSASTSPSVGSRVDSALNSASNSLSSAANNASLQAQTMEWKLSASDIQADLDRNAPIVRTREASQSGKIDTSMVKSSVESRLKADSDLAALKLDVDADKDGSVELSGKANSAEQVGRAIAVTLGTDGVNKVTSKIKLDKNARTNP